GRIIQKGQKLAVLSFGTRLEECKIAAQRIKNDTGIDITIADARFAKPLDEELIKELVRSHEALITIEEGSRGGFGAFVLEFLAQDGLLDAGLKIRTMTLPDTFQDQANPYDQYEEAKLNAAHISDVAKLLITG
ncbi:MAG: 1-deoxy-D-xylulose-5-phosphate synthase, partial [Alphaproteobacteria bacterium]|nr:1-deoxy-D-xylulose-5-phosphate synthase [Alphaproteobacteria bacterium]